MSEPTEQSKTGGNLVLKPAPSELAEQPRSGEGLSPGTDRVPRPLTCCFAGSRPGVTTVGGSTTDGSAGNHWNPSGVW